MTRSLDKPISLATIAARAISKASKAKVSKSKAKVAKRDNKSSSNADRPATANLIGSFSVKACKAFRASADNPKATLDKIGGDLSKLVSALGSAVYHMAHSANYKPWSDKPSLSISGNKWRMTPHGVARYQGAFDATKK